MTQNTKFMRKNLNIFRRVYNSCAIMGEKEV